MEVQCVREKEFKKGGLLTGSDVTLRLSIAVLLSEDEKSLVEKYNYDPLLLSEIPSWYDGTEEAYKSVKIESCESTLSKFRLVATAHPARLYLGNLQKFEKAALAALNYAIDYLKSIDAWEGEEVMTL